MSWGLSKGQRGGARPERTLTRDSAREQMQSMAKNTSVDRPAKLTVFNTLGYIYKESGIKGLYRGVTPRIGLGIWQTVSRVPPHPPSGIFARPLHLHRPRGPLSARASALEISSLTVCCPRFAGLHGLLRRHCQGGAFLLLVPSAKARKS